MANEISKVTLPNGATYSFVDTAAREAASASGSYIVVTELPTASASTLKSIYLIAHAHGTGDSYDEYITVKTGTAESPSYTWEKIGNTDIDLSGYSEKGHTHQVTSNVSVSSHSYTPAGTNAASAVSFTGGTSDIVLGEGTTFTNSTSSVSFTGGSTDGVLGAATTATVPKYTATTKYLTASASGAALDTGSSDAVTGLGTPSTEKFVKSYPGSSKKLATTSVTGVSGKTTASKATAGTAKNVASAGTAVSVPNVTNKGSASTWSFSVSDGALVISGANGSAPTLGTAISITPAVANGTITPYTFSDVDVPVANASATTVATGAVAASDTSGASVLVGLGTASTADGITGITPSTSTFLTSASVKTQPSVSLSVGNATSTGAVTYVQSIGTSGTNSVTFGTNDLVDAVTDIGTGTAAAQTITVGTNDKVTAITGIGTGTAAAQKFTGTAATISHTVTNNTVTSGESSK